jgi:Protein of unknown function (DUF1569)
MDSYRELLLQELKTATAGASDAAMQKSPPGKWNSAQILEHLCLTYKNTNKGIARCLEKGSPLATVATFQHRLKSFVVIGLGYLPEGAKAPERSTPRGMSSAELRTTIFTELQTMYAGLDECERRFGPRTKIMDHPILGPLTVRQWRKFHWLHGRLHARQIRQRIAL